MRPGTGARWCCGEILTRAAQLLIERADEPAPVTTEESGKPLAESRAEWLSAPTTCCMPPRRRRASAGGGSRPGSRGRIDVVYRPVGMVGAITAWNSHLQPQAAIRTLRSPSPHGSPPRFPAGLMRVGGLLEGINHDHGPPRGCPWRRHGAIPRRELVGAIEDSYLLARKRGRPPGMGGRPTARLGRVYGSS